MKDCLVVKVCPTEFMNESRDRRELSVCTELGAKVIVFAKGNEANSGKTENIGGFDVRKCTTRPLGHSVPNPLNRIWSLFHWADKIRKACPDIISGHDLTGLAIGWISTWFTPENKKARLVYDSHEFEIGRNAKRSKLEKVLVMRLEKTLIKKCAFSIMVNESIANEVKNRYKLDVRPLVVRSTPELWHIDDLEKSQIRATFDDYFGSNKTVLMYHGAITNGRGIERLIKSLAKCDSSIVLVLLGNAQSKKYMESLHRMVEEHTLEKRVLFIPAVPIEHLKNYIAAADVEMMIIEPITKSYYYALPNKLFESIQAKTPIIASDLPEITKIVNQYNIGIICESLEESSIVDAIQRMVNDQANFERYKDNMGIAKYELCWENEKKALQKAYAQIMNDQI